MFEAASETRTAQRPRVRKSACYDELMMNSQSVVEALSSSDLLARTRELVQQARCVEADLLVHLGEIDERKLYLERAFPSLFAFCVGELGFSEDIAYSRMTVARAARRLPGIIEAIRSGQVHLTGVRLLVPHLTPENHRELLERAAGKTKAKIEELVVTIAPRPLVPESIRKLPAQSLLPVDPRAAVNPCAAESNAPTGELAAPRVPPHLPTRPCVIAPLNAEAYKIQFTGSRALRDKLRQAQALLRHRVPTGEMATIVEMALDVLIEQVKKERFATGRAPRTQKESTAETTRSRHIPDEIKRAVYARDGGRCTFTDENGRRCGETDALEFDHVDGFALTHAHSVERMRLLCRAHNQHAADKLFGRAFMDRARAPSDSTRSGTSSQPLLL
jgi:5-methylcytosine-specific restriction endonuclease McrA